MGNGLRLVSAGRKSRKGDESAQFDRQDARNAERAERDGHVIVHTTHDVVSSQTMPWQRKNLREWMTDPAKLALYDGILVETDRLARCDDKGWHTIESWCYENGMKIITTEGVQFPARDDSDRYQWVGLKRRARTYWEDVRDKHAQTRELIKANGGAIGLAPFGYRIEGAKLHKTFVIDPVNGPLAHEAFTRIANGHTATSVAIWLTDVTGRMWRVKRVTDMIQRRTYLGERDGHRFEPLVTEALFNSANAAMAARSFTTGGRRTANGFSGLVYCPCGAPVYRHQSQKNGQPVGQEKYRCGRGRTTVGEAKCDYQAMPVAEVDASIDQVMSMMNVHRTVKTITGGDAGRQLELQAIEKAMSEAMARKDMAAVTRLAAEYASVEAKEAQPIEVVFRKTDKTFAQEWADASLDDKRGILRELHGRFVIEPDGVNFDPRVYED